MTISVQIPGCDSIDAGADGESFSFPAVRIDQGVATFSVEEAGGLRILDKLNQLTTLSDPDCQIAVAIPIEVGDMPRATSGTEPEDL